MTSAERAEQEQPLAFERGPLENLELKDSVRHLLRKVPNSVVIITVASIDPDTNKHVPMGIAVSSLSSVTLDPPTISFNIKDGSKTLNAIRAANGLFRIHFLAASLGGAKAVELFCNGNHTAAYKARIQRLKLFIPSSKEDERATASLAPQIKNNFVTAAMECMVTHEFAVADHVILAARVDDVEQQQSESFTMTYADGQYVRTGNIIAVHATHAAAIPSRDSFSVWNFSLFPNKQERQEYVNYIKRMLKQSPTDLDSPEAYQRFKLSLPYNPYALGIQLDILVDKYKRKTGQKSALPKWKRGLPVLSEFWGRLTLSKKLLIIDRAIQLVKEDKKFLEVEYKMFLHYLSVDHRSKDLLPSDFMNALRTKGLVGKFKAASTNDEPKSYSYDLKRMEQLENRVREYLRRSNLQAAMMIPIDDIMESLSEKRAIGSLFATCRGRLASESHPIQFDSSSIDISGNLSEAEIRVVLSRLVLFIQNDPKTNFKIRFSFPIPVLLRRVGVHPSVTGMDVEYLMAKLHHLYFSSPEVSDFFKAADKVVEPFLNATVRWDDSEKRLTNFIKENPIRAITWSKTDILAALGLHWNATVTIPSQSGENTQQSLLEGPILDTLVAKELKIYHEKGTEEERRLIASFLKRKHNFDINPSSADDTQGAMAANQSAGRFGHAVPAPRLRIRFENQDLDERGGRLP